ncbi:hypothetical protein [Halomonas sp. PGE1]|uniref:hypothetical protein n=1 Tax=Halomonas sp. PGE1 TaxID=2730360 RepID=UPI001473DA4C|nr:hypothetical protein [Halomonas sp. PGE1]QJQ99796.1 hypothetical protein HIR79_14790 [Halomonas sp. PGE1]
MPTVNTAATESVETLRPLIEEATRAAEAKRTDALSRMDRGNVRERLLAALEAVKSNPDAAVIQQFAAMLPAHRVGEVNYLPRMLMTLRRENRVSDDQAAAITLALLALIRGEVPAGLMQVDEDWHDAMSVDDLSRMVDWVSPDTLAKIKQDHDTAALDFASASYELKRLGRMREGVELLASPPYKAQSYVKLHNTSQRQFGIKGRQFAPGRAHPVERRELAEMLQHDGFRNAVQSGALEVIR